MSLYTIDSLIEEIHKDLHQEGKNIEDIFSFYENQDNPFISSIKKPMLSVITTKTKKTEKKQSFLSKLFKKSKKNKPTDVINPYKVKAIYSFLSCNTFLSFEKDQVFYVLKEDLSNGIYHVATSMKLPFSSTSVSGIVPKIYFQKID
jgi:hypothetical protein